MESANVMRNVYIDKLTLNIGTGSDERVQENAKKLITLITGRTAADGLSKKRNPSFKITKGSKIAAFVTIRGIEARKLAAKLLDAVDNRVKASSIKDNTFSFGIREYIDIDGIKYDPAIGMLGMNVNLSFKRKGYRVCLRKWKNSSIPSRHKRVSAEEIKEYLSREYKVNFV
ncbi:MAG: hypothetical protein QXN59_01855 [Candidatus Micrarchaeaceae archaeon]